jgi:hypothetical protein
MSFSDSPWLYPLAVNAEEPIKWHSFAERENSSQALCLSAFGSLRAPDFAEVRDRAIANLVGVAFPQMQTAKRPRRWDIQVEVEDTSLLSEFGSSQSTSIDTLLTSSEEVVAIEAKFDRDASEGFGTCGQYRTKKCIGFYGPGSDLATKTSTWCRLENWDGKRSPRSYWSIGKRYFRPSIFAEQSKSDVCRLRGSRYQLMRNFLFASAYAQKYGKRAFGLLIICPKNNDSILQSQLTEFYEQILLPEYRENITLIHYEDWADMLLSNNNHEECINLANFLRDRIKGVLDTNLSKA